MMHPQKLLPEPCLLLVNMPFFIVIYHYILSLTNNISHLTILETLALLQAIMTVPDRS